MNLLSVDLNDLYLFSQVVERQGFTAAGDALNIPKSGISRRISQLESQLGVRLLQRTSRRMSLTDAGQVLYAHCTAMVAEAMAGEAAVRQQLTEPTGTVRASLPVAIVEVVLPKVLPLFMLRNPKVRLNIQATNRQVDMLEENIDVVVRGLGATQESSSLVHARLCSVRWALVASPIYLAEAGTIDQVERLADVETLFYAPMNETDRHWRLLGLNDERLDAPIGKVRLQTDNLSILKETTLSGMGVSSLPLYMCSAEIEAGTLVEVLPEWRPRAGHLTVLFPSRRGLAPAVRSFVDFLKAELPRYLDSQAP